jgi:hypothetical protein
MGVVTWKKQPSFETTSNIASEKHISKFNFALIMIGYDMEKHFPAL